MGKVCPKCGSKNIALFMGSLTGICYRCKDCGYVGVVFLREKEGNT